MFSRDDLERAKEQIKDLIGPPPLVRGESEEQYWKLWEAFVEEHEPKGLSALVEVSDLVNKQWEQNRLSRCRPALIETGLRIAVTKLLRSSSKTRPLSEIESQKIADNYYSGDAEERREAREEIINWGITDDQITAEAMQTRSDGLIAFDRMDNYRVSSRRGLLKDIGRRSDARRNTSDQPLN